ncbi:MAG: adenosylhomocysteinase [Bacillota bacterium]|nr:MAG: adenosylhomocysteinase [Bacillota bacterium]
MVKGDFRSPDLAAEGERRIAWAWADMPVLASIRARWASEKPLEGLRIGACLHVTTETAGLVLTLKEGGAGVVLCASNPLSTQDDVAAALSVLYGVPTYAVRGEDKDTYYRHIENVLAEGPQITMDDGADLVSALHRNHPDLIAGNASGSGSGAGVFAGTEETTTGVIRLRAMAAQGALRYPIVAVNDARTKHWFDNRYGTGQSAIDGLLRATNRLLAGSVFVVAGYGWVGRGVAARANGMGARVIVVEADPLRALEAAMDGYHVTDMDEAAAAGGFFVTATGDVNVIDKPHFQKMRDGAIMANAGHFNVEINIPALTAMATETREARQGVREYSLSDGRRLYLVAEGRLVNLAAAEGHPAAVMDMSFANQALVVEQLAREGRSLEPGVYPVPEAIDRRVAELKLASLGMKVQNLTPEQRKYLESWEAGTE